MRFYGLGFALGGRGHALRFWQSSANGGYQSQFDAYPEVREGAAVMTDGAGGLRLVLKILRAIAEEYYWPGDRMEAHTLAKVDLCTLRMYTGVYLFSGLFKMVVTLDNGQLHLQYGPFGDKPRKLFPETEMRVFMTRLPS